MFGENSDRPAAATAGGSTTESDALTERPLRNAATRRDRGRTLSATLLAANIGLAVVMGGPGHGGAHAEEIERGGWVPNVGRRNFAEKPLGDMWTFDCPKGSTVAVRVDTLDDLDTGQSTLDPFVAIFAGDGTLVGTSDNARNCSYPTVCGALCPEATFSCGDSGPHQLIIRDAFASGCTGGGYRLFLEVIDAKGQSLEESKVKLGGGAKRKLSSWATENGAASKGPLLDDERLPF